MLKELQFYNENFPHYTNTPQRKTHQSIEGVLDCTYAGFGEQTSWLILPRGTTYAEVELAFNMPIIREVWQKAISLYIVDFRYYNNRKSLDLMPAHGNLDWYSINERRIKYADLRIEWLKLNDGSDTDIDEAIEFRELAHQRVVQSPAWLEQVEGGQR